MNWSVIKPAIVAWVRAATGLDAEHVYWAQQSRPEVTGQYVEIHLMSAAVTGQDWLTTEDNPTPAPGQDALHVARGARVLSVNFQCYGGGAADAYAEAATPVQALESVLAAVRLPTPRAALRAAGLGFATHGAVLSLDGFPGAGVFEPRASVDVRLHAVSEDSEVGASFDRVELVIEGESTWVPDPPP